MVIEKQTQLDVLPADNAWHSIESSAVLASMSATESGLTTSKATELKAQHGPNSLAKKKPDSAFKLIWRQINNPLIWVLIASAGVALAVDPVDGVKNGAVILAVVILNALVGYVQEARASKAIEALKDFVPEFATVLRDGKKVSLPVAELVPGDIVSVASGDRVPADIRLVQCRTLLIEEAALTGESVPSEKQLQLAKIDAPLGDRRNMLFGGTLVTQGAGTGVVVATGNYTELGRINKMLHETTDLETPLSQSLNQIGKILTIGIGVVSVFMVFVGAFRATTNGTDFMVGVKESLIFAITLAVGAIPEGLPAIVTIALAIGVQRMAQRKAVVRTLPAVETLGSTSTICSDKTGTLTKNEMTVQGLWTKEDGIVRLTGVGYEPVGNLGVSGINADRSASIERLLVGGALCNDATLEQVKELWKINGDPTEGALVVSAEKVGIEVDKLRKKEPRIDAIPFESDYQFMATLHQEDYKKVIFLKGAPEVVIKRCVGVDAEAIIARINEFAGEGMRVLAVAEKACENDKDHLGMEDVESGMTFLGLQAMIDPPRQEVIEAIRIVHGAGVTVKMITGDHQKTAEAIGDQLGITQGKDAVTGAQLQKMTDEELKIVVGQTNIFARVAPEHKLRLVRALQANGEITAMTGDGVNDAPALKQSNIGIAMGITGTSVSKEASDIVLADDNFSSIVAAVEEGRRVYDNLIKSLAFVLPTNLGLAMILICAVAFFPFQGKELLLPMLPTQILWINLVATVALALPLAFESKEPDVMQRKPRNPKEPILNKFVIFRTFMAATLMTMGAVGLFLYKFYSELPRVNAGEITATLALAEAQSMAVTTVIFFQIFYMLNCRSLRDSVFKIGFFSNKSVFVGIGAVLAFQALFLYTAPLNKVFGSAPLGVNEILLSVFAGMIILPVITIEKMIRSRKVSTT